MIATVMPEDAIINNAVPMPKLFNTSLYSISPNKGKENISSNVDIDIGRALLIHKIKAEINKPTAFICDGSYSITFERITEQNITTNAKATMTDFGAIFFFLAFI
jgi:hypothetical protein